MAKYYDCIFLNIKKNKLQNLEKLNDNKIKVLTTNYVIYIYRSTSSGKIYIGQTNQFLNRHLQHYNGTEEKFNDANFNEVIVLHSYLFNGSALDDIESQLITYFNADKENANKPFILYDTQIINKNGGNRVSEYLGRENISTDVILPFWENVLYPNGWVETPTLEELRTRALVKYSPIKQLTNEQILLIQEIINSPHKNYIINGDAGTGKTVLLTHLVAQILNSKPNSKIGIVVQPNWEKIGKKIFKIFGMNSINLTVTTSTKLIADSSIFDVIIVDESHKLSRRGNKQMDAFNQVYLKLQYSNCQSHLEIIQKLGKQIVLMYDILQAIRPANISREEYQKLTINYEKRFLTTQFRIQPSKDKSYSSEDYVNGIKYLLYKDTGLLDSEFTKFNPNFNRDVFKDKSEDAYFGYFSTKPLHNMVDWLYEDRNCNPEHINRILAGLIEDWKQTDGKNINKKHFFEGDISRRWNSAQDNWINSDDVDAEEQIGSVFAVQGIDLNKVGVLIGNDLQVDENGRLYGDPNNLRNVNCKFSKEKMPDPKNKFEFTLFVLNMYYVLMTRGIDGIRLGFWKNNTLQNYLEKTLDIK